MNNISFPKLGIEFNIDPIAVKFDLLGGGIHWYGIIIAVGIILAVSFCCRIAKQEQENPDILIDFLLWALPVSIVCARTYYVVFSWESYKDDLLSIFSIWEGGLAIYGGIIGAVITAAVFFKIKKRSILKMCDICCMGLLIGQSIGRWGNFVNGEAFGGPCGFLWGMSVNGADPVHPTFLYESLWNAIGLVILALINKKRPFYGFTFAIYLIWYGTGRFFIEGMRADSLMIGEFRVSQLVAVFCIISGILILLTKLRNCNKKITKSEEI